MRYLALLLVAASALISCSQKPKPFDQLKIQDVESGPVPASTVANLPAEEGVVASTREPAGTMKVVYRKTIPCPARMISSVTGFKALPDRIQLCFEPVEAKQDAAAPLSACPYNLAIKHELTGIPATTGPKFELVSSCQGFK